MSNSSDITKTLEKHMNGGVTIIIFGASGDLAKKKTYPALYKLHKTNHLPKNTTIIGYARSELGRDDYMQRVTMSIDEEKEDKNQLEQFKKICIYESGGYDDEQSFKKLKETIEKAEKERGSKEGQCNRLFYLATPPSVYLDVAKGCKSHLTPNDGKSVSRIIIEKPFGRDLESCQYLLKNLSGLFTESETYRIDHFLGKEMIKNIMTLRFANLLFSPIWNQQYIASVQITLKETFGCQGRGGYFDEYGAIRDVIQNHILQIMTFIAMERPVERDAESIRDEKVKLLRSVQPVDIQDTLLGQYVANKEKDKPGYLDDETVPNDSITPTYAALVLWVDNERWDGVPFILKSGKAVDVDKGEVRIQFKKVPGHLYPDVVRNELVIRIEPDELMYIKFNNKCPGLTEEPIVTDLDLTYKERYQNLDIPNAYEAMFLDILCENQANFVRDDELLAAWRIFTPLLHQLEKEKVKPEPYEHGSRGPEKEAEFIERYDVERLSKRRYTWPKQDVR